MKGEISMSLEEKQYYLQLSTMDKLIYLTEMIYKKDARLVQNLGFYLSVVEDCYYAQLFPLFTGIPKIADQIDQNAFFLFHLS